MIDFGDCIILHLITSLAVGILTKTVSGGIMSKSIAIGIIPDSILARSVPIGTEGTVHPLVLLRHPEARHLQSNLRDNSHL